MSVTLKLSDGDAAVVASILKAVAEPLPAIENLNGESDYSRWYRHVRYSHTGRDAEKLREIAGAFTVVVRANQRGNQR